MTDSTEDRLAALAARRGSRSATTRSPGVSVGTTTEIAPVKRKRRTHAAAGGRILATGLSVSAALIMAGAMASTKQSDPVVTTAPAVTAPPTTSPPVIVRVVMANTSAAATPTPAPPVVMKAPVKVKATATSRGS